MRTLSAAIISFAIFYYTAASAETWQPISNTAVAVTGTVQFTSNKITFENGRSLSIRAASKAGLDGQVFEVMNPADPVLLRGNKLCGRSTVKFLVVDQAGGRDRGLAVYDGPSIPFQDTPSCASYSYRAGRR